MSRRRRSRGRYESSRRDDRSPSRYSGGKKHSRRGRRDDGTSDSEDNSRRRSRRSPDSKHRRARRHSQLSDGIYSDDNRGRSSRDARRGRGGKDEDDLKHYINLIYKEFKAMLNMVNEETEIIKQHPSMTKAPRTTRSLYEGKIKIPKRPDDSEDSTALDMIKELENGIQEAQDKLSKSYRNRFFKLVKSGMERNPNPSSRTLRRRNSDDGSRDGSDLDDKYESRKPGRRKYRDERGRKDKYGEDRYKTDRRRGDRHQDRRRDRHRDDDRKSRSRYSRDY